MLNDGLHWATLDVGLYQSYVNPILTWCNVLQHPQLLFGPLPAAHSVLNMIYLSYAFRILCSIDKVPHSQPGQHSPSSLMPFVDGGQLPNNHRPVPQPAFKV